MILFLLRRIGQAVPVMLVTAFLSFAAFRFIGDPVQNMLGQDATAADRAQLEAALGLDQPFLVQFGHSVWKVLHGDFGISTHLAGSVDLMDGFTLPFSRNEFSGTFFLLGADDQGRDMVSAVLFGARASLIVGIAAVALAATIGVTLGLTAAYFGGRIDALIMRLADVQMSIPSILMALLIFGLTRSILPSGMRDAMAIYVVILAIGLSEWVSYARTVHGAAMVEMRREYIQAAMMMGRPARAILFRHLLPNVARPILVISTISFALAVIAEAVKRDRFPVAGLASGVDAALEWLAGGQARAPDPDKALVELRDVGMVYGGGRGLFRTHKGFVALGGISLRIGQGEVLGLAGESGSGKSTMARILAGLVPPSSGRMLFDGQDVFAASGAARAEIRRQTQMVFQDPYSSLNPRMSVGNILAEPLLQHRFVPSAAAARPVVAQLLAAVGLPPDATRRYPHAFSGGQRQRISIARALASRPRFLICDEPTSALDASIQAQILNLMKDLQQRLGLTILFISHDLPEVRQMCDRVAVLQGGALREVAPTEQLFLAPRDPYVRQLLSLIPAMPATTFTEDTTHA